MDKKRVVLIWLIMASVIAVIAYLFGAAWWLAAIIGVVAVAAIVAGATGTLYLRQKRLLDGLQAEGDEPVLMLWSVAEDIRTMIRLAAALRQGKTVAQVRNELRLWGDKAQYAAQAAYRFSAGQWLELLQECAKIDRQIKGAEDGNAWDSLRHLLMRLSRTN